MPYETLWFIKNEIVINRFWGEVTKDDLRKALRQSNEFIDSSTRNNVHILSDIRRVTYPLKLQDSMKVVQEFKREDMAGWEITIGHLDAVTKFGLMIARSVLKQKAISFLTMDEAIDYLKKQDATITWSKADTAATQ